MSDDVQRVRSSDSRGGGHSQYWPPSRNRLHTHSHFSCYLEQCGVDESAGWRMIWDSNIHKPLPVHSYSEWKEQCKKFNHGIDCYVGDFLSDGRGFPWIEEAMHDERASISCSLNHNVTGIKIRLGRYNWCCVGSLKAWDTEWADKNPQELLTAIRTVSQRIGTESQEFAPDTITSFSSPAQLGYFSLCRSWIEGSGCEEWYPKVAYPKRALRTSFFEHGVGGRAEKPTMKVPPGMVNELDMRSAYASCTTEIPFGPIVFLPSPQDNNLKRINARYATWWGECTVTITHQLKVGPFPFRANKHKPWTYPRKPGTYRGVWLWREEADACMRAGCIVTIQQCWCWEQLSNRLIPWKEEMEGYRVEFERQGKLVEAALVKRAIVAAIGRLGCHPLAYSLAQNYQKGDTILVDQKTNQPTLSNRFIHAEPVKECRLPTHFYAYILMRCRLALYERHRLEVESGNTVYASNFDALYTRYRSKHPTGNGIGEWKENEWATIPGVDPFPYNRALAVQGKIRYPGLGPKARLRLLPYSHSADGATSLPASLVPVVESPSVPHTDGKHSKQTGLENST